MGVEVVHDGEPANVVAENCCLCRKPTRYWFRALDVALCQPCAKAADEGALPSKQVWMAKERALCKRPWEV